MASEKEKKKPKKASTNSRQRMTAASTTQTTPPSVSPEVEIQHLLSRWRDTVRPYAGVSGWYSFPVRVLPADVLDDLKRCLTARPARYMADPNDPNGVQYPWYCHTNVEVLGIPRALGLQWIGPPWSPQHDRRTLGASMQPGVTFSAQLDAKRQQPHAVRRLFAAWTHEHGYCPMSLMSLPCGYGKTVTAVACALELVPAVLAWRQLGSSQLQAQWSARVAQAGDDGDQLMTVLRELARVAGGHHTVSPRKTLVIVPTSCLLTQWQSRIRDLAPQVRVGTLRQDTIEVADCDMTIALLHSLCKRNYPLRNVLDQFGLVIVDEAHHLAAEWFSQALTRLPAEFVLGLSATIRRGDKLEYALSWFMGPIDVSVTRPAARGTVHVHQITYSHGNHEVLVYHRGPYKGRAQDIVMQKRMAADPRRNRLLVDILIGLLERPPLLDSSETCDQTLEECPTRHILVFSRFCAHLKTLQDMLARRGFGADQVALYTGQALAKCSAETKQELARRAILLTTYTLAREGLDVPTLDTMVQALPGGDLEQPVGRILRGGTEGTSAHVPLIVDVVDPFSVYETRMFKRNHFYKKQGYRVSRWSSDTWLDMNRQARLQFWQWMWVTRLEPYIPASCTLLRNSPVAESAQHYVFDLLFAWG